MGRRQAGLSLLEFTLVVVIFSALAAVFLSRVAAIRVEVERASIRQTLNQMRSALAVRFADLYISGDDEAIARWTGGNALRLVRNGADAGNVEAGDAVGRSPPGEWAFDDGIIVYRPAFPEALTGDPTAVGRWRVVLDGTLDNPRGLRLRAIDPLLEDEPTVSTGAE